MAKNSRAKAIELAAEAHSDLNTFYAIMAICESGCFRPPSYDAVARIIRICQAESTKRVRDYDRETAKILAGEKADG